MTDTFTSVFGGSTVQPSEVAYRAIALSASVTLYWPQQTADTTNIAARWNDVTPTTSGLTITLGPATAISTGQDATFSNLGADTFTILANDGSTITTVSSSTVVYLINANNSTAAGSWRVTTFGATTSSANAATLAGSGLSASANTLNQNILVDGKNSDYTVTTGDRATLLLWTGGAGTFTLPDPATTGNGFMFSVANQGTGALVLSPAAGLIDAASTKTINQTESAEIRTNGTNYYSVGYGRSSTVSFTRLVKSVAGAANVTLTAAEAVNQMQEYTGALTGNISVIVPTNAAQYFVFNNTSGAFTLTVKTAAGTGIAVAQGTRTILNCDGTNVISAVAVGSGTVTSIATGTGLTGGPITGTGTVAIATTGVTAGSYTLANVTVNAQGQLTTASSGTATANTFTADQTISSATAGAGVGPNLNLLRNKGAGVAADLLGDVIFQGMSSTSVQRSYAQILAGISSPTNAAEAGNLFLATTQAGTLATRATLGAGMFMAGATGGDKGAGTVNATGLYVNGVKPVVSVARQTFIASGTYTPSTGMLYAFIQVQAPGGGSGGCATTSGTTAANVTGAGGGEYAEGWFTAAQIGASKTVTIGAVGAAGTAGANAGGTGGTSSVGALITAVGGSGSPGGTATATASPQLVGPGASGGTGGTGGDRRQQGGDGFFGGWVGNGNAFSGPGGSSYMAGNAAAANNNAVGNTGRNYGGGASGSVNTVSQAARAGAAGGASIIVITEYCSQ